MENRIRFLLLSAVVAMAGCSSLPWRDDKPVEAPATVAPAEGETPVVIEPQVERRDIKPAKIDAENWEAGLYVGSLSIEDFEVNVVYGGRIAYHISEDFFAEAIVGTSDAGLSSFERLSGGAPLLTDSEREFTYYSLGFGWNALPGEIFLGGKRALNSAVYLTLGAGSTRFAGDDRFTLTGGAGVRVLVKDWLAVHLDMRDHVMEIDVLGREKTSHNYEATLSLTAFF
jgi:outer membrane beta-barrel protein